jgi:hypothetical protein
VEDEMSDDGNNEIVPVGNNPLFDDSSSESEGDEVPPKNKENDKGGKNNEDNSKEDRKEEGRKKSLAELAKSQTFKVSLAEKAQSLNLTKIKKDAINLADPLYPVVRAQQKQCLPWKDMPTRLPCYTMDHGPDLTMSSLLKGNHRRAQGNSYPFFLKAKYHLVPKDRK